MIDARLLALGGKHEIFRRTCTAIAFRDLGVREGEGGSAGAIAMALAMAGMKRDRAEEVARDFDLSALLDGQERAGLRAVGSVEGRSFTAQLGNLFQDLRHEHWRDFRHTPTTRPPQSDWDYSLTVRVAVMTFRNRTIESVREELSSPWARTGMAVTSAVRRKALVPYTFPFSEGGTCMASDDQPVVPILVDSARHILVFQPDLYTDGPHVRAVVDGAMFTDMGAFERVIPDRPTIFVRSGRDADNPDAQLRSDRARYPGYFVFRTPELHAGLAQKLSHSIDFSLDAKQRIDLARQGFEDVERYFDERAFGEYHEQWTELRAQTLMPEADPHSHHWFRPHLTLPSVPGRLRLGPHQLRPATEVTAPTVQPEMIGIQKLPAPRGGLTL